MCKVLLVEDEKRIADSLSEILQSNGFEVLTANSGTEALTFALQSRPHIVVTDLMMPEMDGHELLKQFRATVSTDIPFIVITAKSGYADLRSAMEEGFDDYITKPFKACDLINAINKRLERKSEYNKPLEDRVLRFETAIKLITNHEFNTPMTAIKGFADLISHHGYEIGKDDLKQYVEYINGGADRLITLFRRLRLWQQLERNIFDCTKVDVLLDEIYFKNLLERNNNYTLRRSDIKLTISSVCLFGCMELFDLLFCELLDNAIKFSKLGTVIKIVTLKANDDISINISNENPFVEAEQLENYQIFQQFNRLEQEQQGLGIGLGLVKHIIKALRGQLSFYKMENVLTVQVKFKNYDK